MKNKLKISILLLPFAAVIFLGSGKLAFANTLDSYKHGDIDVKTGNSIYFKTIENSGSESLIIITNNHQDSCKDNCNRSTVPPAITASNGLSGSNNNNSGFDDIGVIQTGSAFPMNTALWLYIASLISVTVILRGWYLRYTTGVSPPIIAQVSMRKCIYTKKPLKGFFISNLYSPYI